MERLAAQIQQTQMSIEKAQDELRTALKSIAESLYLALATKTVFPPPPHLTDRILKSVNDVAVCAFPDEKERTPGSKKWVISSKRHRKILETNFTLMSYQYKREPLAQDEANRLAAHEFLP